jgi:lipopolysaccharide biosynthesis glycosyltransferase
MFFSDWATKDITRRLPFIYNMTATAVYSYRPAYKHYGKDVKIVHFIGSPKPWQVPDPSALPTPVASEHVNQWWQIFSSKVQPQLTTSMVSFLYFKALLKARLSNIFILTCVTFTILSITFFYFFINCRLLQGFLFSITSGRSNNTTTSLHCHKCTTDDCN